MIRWSSFGLGVSACLLEDVITGDHPFSWFTVTARALATLGWLALAWSEHKAAKKEAANRGLNEALKALEKLVDSFKSQSNHPSTTGPSKPPRVH